MDVACQLFCSHGEECIFRALIQHIHVPVPASPIEYSALCFQIESLHLNLMYDDDKVCLNVRGHNVSAIITQRRRQEQNERLQGKKKKMGWWGRTGWIELPGTHGSSTGVSTVLWAFSIPLAGVGSGIVGNNDRVVQLYNEDIALQISPLTLPGQLRFQPLKSV